MIDEKDPDVEAEYGIDFQDLLVLAASRRSFFSVGEVLFYPRDTGWYYTVTASGKTGMAYPESLPRESGLSLTDGSCTLECVHPSAASLPLLSNVTWTLPDGLTFVDDRTDGMKALVTVSGGTDGVDYDVLCRITPSVGEDIERTITIPVRAQ